MAGRKRCSQGKWKFKCVVCSGCPHGKRKTACAECTPWPHGKVKGDCAECKAARAAPPSSKRIKREKESSSETKLEPEIKQEPFTIRGYFGFDEGEGDGM